MSVALVVLVAISFVAQILLIRHKFIKRRWGDLLWDLPAAAASIWLGAVGGATVMAAMIVASNVLSIALLFSEDRTPRWMKVNPKDRLVRGVKNLVQETVNELRR